jgi:predicted nucleic-acid-binding protein
LRVALDTNVLVRYLTWDDNIQSPLAANAIETADTIMLPAIVLCETAWVLARAYKLPAKDIAAVLRRFIQAETVEVDRPLAEAGLASLDSGGDFADGVILLEAERARADHLVTFDKAFFKRAKSKRVKWLAPP